MDRLRLRARTLLALVVAGSLLAACGDSGEEASGGAGVDREPTEQRADENAASEVSVALVLNGELGDEAFFDSADRGGQRAMEELGVDVQVIEAGLDPSGWEPALRSAVASGDHDLVINGTFPMADVLAPIAEEFPDQQFVFYDAELPGENIHSILYSQNEASYLGGVVAGSMTTGDAEGINPEPVLGFVGGLELPVINDFLAGYEQGARSVNPDIEVLTAYAGGFGDPARGLELAEAQIDEGADIVFQVAGGTGFGVFEAATGRGVYAIGVDSNQNPLAPGTVLTSVMKNVDNSLFQAIERYVAGELPFGVTETLGLAENGVGLARDELYEELVPEDVRQAVDEAEAAIVADEIDVESTLDR